MQQAQVDVFDLVIIELRCQRNTLSPAVNARPEAAVTKETQQLQQAGLPASNKCTCVHAYSSYTALFEQMTC
jgi:hypothetical protein